VHGARAWYSLQGMTDAPPSRYRIIERDRRLIVIDQWGQQPPRGAEPVNPLTSGSKPSGSRRPAANPLAGLRRTGFDGRAELVTQRWYDAKGPRTLKLDSGTAALLGRARGILLGAIVLFVVLAIWMPWVLVIPALLVFQPKARKSMLAASTAYIDRLEAGLL